MRLTGNYLEKADFTHLCMLNLYTFLYIIYNDFWSYSCSRANVACACSRLLIGQNFGRV